MGYGETDRAVSQSQFLKYAEDLAAVYDLERKRRSELKLAYEGISDLVHGIRDGAFIANSSGTIQEINLTACTLLGKNRSQVIGKPVQDVLPLPSANISEPSTAPSAPSPGQTISTSSGRIIRLISTAMKNGWLFYLLHDVTEEMRIENLKQDFLALLSHELRTPLAGILGFSELLMAQNGQPLSDMDAVHNIHHSGMRMLKIVDELLRFATLQGERCIVQMEPLQLSLLISSIFDAQEGIAQKKGISLFIDHDAMHPVIIRGNSPMIRDLFTHVIQNSIIFGKTDGNVVVRIHPATGANVSIDVVDDGIGISPEALKNVFHSFYQVEEPLNRTHQGLGLGLSIAQIIARIHNGTVELASEIDQGTTCTITLPLNSRDT